MSGGRRGLWRPLWHSHREQAARGHGVGYCGRQKWKQPGSPPGQEEGLPRGQDGPTGPTKWRRLHPRGFEAGGLAALWRWVCRFGIPGWALGLGAGLPSGLSGPGPCVPIKQAWLLGTGVKWPNLALSDAICEWSPVGNGQFQGLEVGIWAAV